MIMNTDVINFVNYINRNSNTNSNKKRARDELSTEDILIDIKLAGLDRLKQASKKDLKLKGRELTKYITGLKETFYQFIVGMKTDKQVKKQIPELIRLWLIAEVSVTITLLEEMIKSSMNDRTKTFEVFIDDINKKLVKLVKDPNKRFKPCDSENPIVFTFDNLENGELDVELNVGLNDKLNVELNEDLNEDDYEEDSEADTSDEEDELEADSDDKQYNLITSPGIINKKNDREFVSQIFKSRNEDDEDTILKYFSKLSSKEKTEALATIKSINNYQATDKPILFKIMELPLPLSQKNHILKNYTELANSRLPENKLRTWFDSLMTIPFGQYKGINLTNLKSKKVIKFLDSLQNAMDQAVYGHDEAKRQIIQMMGQQIRNPKAKGNMLGIYGPPGNGKCFAIDTPVLMHDGTIKKVQDVNVGEMVMGDDSGTRTVLSLGRGQDEMYEIKSNKNESYTVNSEHILCLKASGLDKIKKIKGNKFKVQYFDKKEIKFQYKSFNKYGDANKYLESQLRQETDDTIEITVKDYLKLSNNIKNKLKGYKVGVDFNRQSVDFDSYIIGVWLGGSTSEHEITLQDSTILQYLRNELANYNLNLQHVQDYTYRIVCDLPQNTTKCLNPFINALTKYNLINNKHIPDEYKINDRTTRLKLLAGLIDSKGYYNETMKNYEIIQKSKQLSDDIVFLSRSLGFYCYQHKTEKSCTDKDKVTFEEYYRTQIYKGLEDIPVLCPRKKPVTNAKHKNSLVSGIKVNPKGPGNYYGFTLDGNNRFLLGDFTVTHNTSLIKEGIAKAMDKPFVFISLGGATDSSFLEGHSYTYEGSIYGRIANGLITSKCMDPIIYFDELDKISKSHKGEEITNLLVHLTDPVQNSHFRDKYFHGIDIDLSRATMIFSFNDPHNVNPILMDRITTVETKYLMISQKIHIATNYILPEMIKDMGLEPNDINMTDDTIRHIVNTYTNEGGVRKLKSILYNICRELNLANLIKGTIDDQKVKFPFTVEPTHLKSLLKHKMEISHDKVHLDDKPGIVNGLWANSLGQGGILSIETMLVPSASALSVKATGHLEKVIKESTEVATSLAWNYLPDNLKTKLLTEWKDRPMGIHIHCPDGATPKDGPSAGAALTIALYSLLTGRKIKHDIAMTGEINLEGKVTAIGGLEEKLEGAKRAGVKLVLYPKENQKHIDKIRERNVSLIGEDFQVIPIESFDDVMTMALTN